MDRDEQIEAICAMFRCEAATADVLVQAAAVQHLAADEILARQGAPAEHCWFVTRGAVRVYAYGIEGQVQQLAQHGPGELFGAYPAPSPHRAEIAAVRDSVLLCIETPKLVRAVAENAQIGAGLARLLARQLDRALDRMVTRTTYSAAGRVYAELLALAEGSDRISPAPKVTALALSANTTRETASRALNVLIRRGVVSRDEHELVINAPRMLLEMIC